MHHKRRYGATTPNSTADNSKIVKSSLSGKSVISVRSNKELGYDVPAGPVPLWPVNGNSRWGNKRIWQPGSTPPPATIIRSRGDPRPWSGITAERGTPADELSPPPTSSSSAAPNATADGVGREEEQAGGVIFSSDFNALRRGGQKKLKYARLWQAPPLSSAEDKRRRYFDRPTEVSSTQPQTLPSGHSPIPPSNPTPVIQYNYLADSSLSQIEIWPYMKFQKHTSYLTRWWVRAKKWGLLCDDLLRLERDHLNGLMRQAGTGTVNSADSNGDSDSGDGSSSSSSSSSSTSSISSSSSSSSRSDSSTPYEEIFDEDEDSPAEDEDEDRGPSPRIEGKERAAAPRTSLPRGFQSRLREYCAGKRARVLVVRVCCVVLLTRCLCLHSPGHLTQPSMPSYIHQPHHPHPPISPPPHLPSPHPLYPPRSATCTAAWRNSATSCVRASIARAT